MQGNSPKERLRAVCSLAATSAFRERCICAGNESLPPHFERYGKAHGVLFSDGQEFSLHKLTLVQTEV